MTYKSKPLIIQREIKNFLHNFKEIKIWKNTMGRGEAVELIFRDSVRMVHTIRNVIRIPFMKVGGLHINHNFSCVLISGKPKIRQPIYCPLPFKLDTCRVFQLNLSVHRGPAPKRSTLHINHKFLLYTYIGYTQKISRPI